MIAVNLAACRLWGGQSRKSSQSLVHTSPIEPAGRRLSEIRVAPNTSRPIWTAAVVGEVSAAGRNSHDVAGGDLAVGMGRVAQVIRWQPAKTLRPIDEPQGIRVSNLHRGS